MVHPLDFFPMLGYLVITMSWDASDEDTWDRWERQSRARRVAGAGGNGSGGAAGETTAARSRGGGTPPITRDPESLHPAYGLHDPYPHEED